jgi:hypothetical protein
MRSILKTPCYAQTIEFAEEWQKPEYLRLFDGVAVTTTVIPARCVSIEPQGCNCTLGNLELDNLELPGSLTA